MGYGPVEFVQRSTKAGESFAASAPSVSKKPNNGSHGKPKSDARPASLVRALNAISQIRQKSAYSDVR